MKNQRKFHIFYSNKRTGKNAQYLNYVHTQHRVIIYYINKNVRQFNNIFNNNKKLYGDRSNNKPQTLNLIIYNFMLLLYITITKFVLYMYL